MTHAPIPEATSSGTIDFGEWKTWYRITGDLHSGMIPLVTLHGGPGAAHDYLLSVADIARTGRPVIHYDQLGIGRSTHLPDRGEDFWTVDLFLRELDNLLARLGISSAYHLLGQSWGGMLAAEHAVRKPTGLRSLIISDSPASMALWLSAANELRSQLPVEVQEVLTKHETAGTTDSAEYEAAEKVFYDRHVCRIVPRPPEVDRSFAAIEEDPTVYHTMNGPSEFHVVGSLKSWNIIDQLHNIEVPTLVISGRYDEATPETVRPYAERIPNARWHIFPNSSHMPHVEERDEYMKLVEDFLEEHDRQQ
jgi:L-proline amide hydrolase